MPNYKVRYKVAAEPDSRFWLVGPYPDKETALAWFNSGDARRLELGQFKFDQPGCFTSTDYFLVEGNEEYFFHLIKIVPPTNELLKDLRERAASATVVSFRTVQFKNGEPQLNKCHENVAAWLNENRQHKPVRGWLVIGGLQLYAHSVVSDMDGILFDITPLQTPRLPFLPHLGSEDDFWHLPAEIPLARVSI